MSPVDFMEEHGNGPCVFGTHHEFSGCPSPWYATNAVAGVSGGIPSGAADPIDPPQPKSAPSSMSASVHQSASRGGTPNLMEPNTVPATSSTGLAPRTPPYPPPNASRGGKGGHGGSSDESEMVEVDPTTSEEFDEESEHDPAAGAPWKRRKHQ